MRFFGRKLTRFLILLWVTAWMVACAPSAQPQENDVSTTQPPVSITQPPQSQDYPATPEEVIRAFLIVYPSTPVNGIQYLSPGLVQNLDEVSATELLPQPGEIHGFIIEEGSASPGSEQSQILTSIAYLDKSYKVRFFLVIQDGRWCINNISLE